MEELEKTYLLKHAPVGFLTCSRKEIIDIYIPSTVTHPVLRVRKSGNKYEITKKIPVVESDASLQLETTISLSEEEYATLSDIVGKRIHKIRYYYNDDIFDYEIDVFQDTLKGLILVEVEFSDIIQKAAFQMPDSCLADVTQEKFIAGGMLCGKSYADIEKDLKRFAYEKIVVE